jgi:hypothetical protein
MSFFDNIAQADVYNNLPYIEPGEYTFVIENVLHIKSKMGKGDFLIAEFLVETADGQSQVLVPGARCSSRIKLADTMGPKNAAAFLTAAVSSLRGKQISKLEPADEAICIGPDSKLRGQRVKVSALMRPKKTKPGESYVHVNWFPVTG